MGEISGDNVCANLHVPVRVFAEPTRRLNKVIVHDPEHPIILVVRGVVFRKTEMKARLQPVPITPGWKLFVPPVPKHSRVRFTNI